MKIAIVKALDNGSFAGSGKVWVEDNKMVGDLTQVSGIIGDHLIIGFLAEEPQRVEPSQEEEYVKAISLECGDVIFDDRNGWCTVVSNYLHARSPWAKLSVIPEKDSERYRLERICGLSIKKSLDTNILRKTRKHLMSINLITSHDLLAQVQAKLTDLSALENANERLEVAPSVFVDKQAVTASIKTDLRAAYSKLGEAIKRL